MRARREDTCLELVGSPKALHLHLPEKNAGRGARPLSVREGVRYIYEDVMWLSQVEFLSQVNRPAWGAGKSASVTEGDDVAAS